MARKYSFPIDPEAGKITPLQNNEEKKIQCVYAREE